MDRVVVEDLESSLFKEAVLIRVQHRMSFSSCQSLCAMELIKLAISISEGLLNRGSEPFETQHALEIPIWCSRKKWREMSEEKRLHCVIEEAAILALERSIIPALYLEGESFLGAEWAYKMALFKICTTITSGWFRDYAIERYWDAVEARPDFVKAFFTGMKLGIVKILKPEVVCG